MFKEAEVSPLPPTAPPLRSIRRVSAEVREAETLTESAFCGCRGV